VIGPDTVGLMIPSLGLNASLAHLPGRPGRIALVSQSGAIAAALIDWAAERGSASATVVGLGDMADVDAGDYLDLLAGDGTTRAILLYLETIPAARKFLSAARAAARLKPVIALKPGRSAAARPPARRTPAGSPAGDAGGGRRAAASGRAEGAGPERDVRGGRDGGALSADAARAGGDRDQRRRARACSP
jgi:acetyltransferase